MSEFICYRIENNYAVDCENNKITLGELVTVINKTINTSVANAEKIKKLQAKLAKKDEQLLKAKTLLRYHSELPMSENVKEFLNE